MKDTKDTKVRLFVAVDVSEETRAELRRLRGLIESAIAEARVLPRVTWVKDDSAHVTVRFVGEVSDECGAALAAALGQGFDVPPFDVRWETIGTFPGGRSPRSIWVGATSGAKHLDALAERVDDRLTPIIRGLRELRDTSKVRPFKAHLTLARIKEPGNGVHWPQVLASARPTGTTTRVEHVTLYRSHLSSKGPTYTALCQASLRTKVTS